MAIDAMGGLVIFPQQVVIAIGCNQCDGGRRLAGRWRQAFFDRQTIARPIALRQGRADAKTDRHQSDRQIGRPDPA